MTIAAPLPLKFQIGARTLFTLKRRLVRVALSLDDARAERAPVVPALDAGADGYLVTSLPEDRLGEVAAARGMIAHVRQRYTRYFADLAPGYDAWWAGLSGNTRSTLKRKTKKAGAVEVRRYRTPAEIEEFHALARVVAATTYQEKLLGAGLPDTPVFRHEMVALAAAGQVRAWLLFVEGRAVAYLYCPIVDSVVIYAYVGHDPAVGVLSPGTLLQWEAMRDLFAEGDLRAFDFTEGEGQHKRALASGGVACVDLLLLRPTVANRAAIAALAGFDGAVARAKRLVARGGLRDMVRKLRRG
ncbi:GNAT family N-acetyltransferase [Sphingomonas donggukensis]|uniref:GNAT family N-acetyltransferase n=1 Tax=Sphingomonas donggukensis TaxID=2949093 RepID=A0ABY4TUD3_9SPHN|nr:GNAT family N-acetyltransferase [Sphingomonas donggukensis]URW76010.1 GNAT family N-acetyltransferase [Sphingomonas donggukensis]